jgi:citrate synthase
VVAEHLRAGRPVPGLGHRLYRGEDPRARLLLRLLADVPAAAPALAAARDVVSTAARHSPLHANVDLALGVLSVSSGMPAEAGETVFAVARTAGWIAHALEEYAERPLRMRPGGGYDGPPPGRQPRTAPGKPPGNPPGRPVRSAPRAQTPLSRGTRPTSSAHSGSVWPGTMRPASRHWSARAA